MSLHYGGHVFDTIACSCCVGDQKKVLIDPTQTGNLRARFRGTMAIRWRQLRVQVREMITKHDLLQLSSTSNPSIMMGSTKIQAFQRWFNQALDQTVLGRDGSVMRPFIVQGYNAGALYAQGIIDRPIMSSIAGHRSDALFQLAVTELQGITQAVSQQATRAVAQGLLTSQRPMSMVRAIWGAIDKVGINRTNAMIELLVVRAHAEASLDIYAAAKIKSVGLVAEGSAVKVGDDLAVLDARRKGAGAKSYSKKKAPSKSTIARIRRQEAALARKLGQKVNVRTAGDDKVCLECEAISEEGPYAIDDARALIPAHPRCRCVFVPAGDKRFAKDDFNPELHPRGPNGKWITKGSSGERVQWRKQLKTETDPKKRQILKERIMASFEKQYAKSHDPVIASKIDKYSKLYNLPNPLHAGGFGVKLSEPQAAAYQQIKSSEPANSLVHYSKQEQEAYKDLVGIAGESSAKGWLKQAELKIAAGKGGELTKAEAAHIIAYTGNAYRQTNAQLRAGSMSEATYNHAKSLSAALDKLPPYEATVYRKADLTGEQFGKYHVGNIVQERGFTSTSKEQGTWSGDYRYVIKSKNGRDISRLSSHSSEKEVLFKPNSNFRVSSKSGNTIYMDEL